MTVGIGLRNLQAAISQPECSIDMKGRALSAGRSAVRVRGPGPGVVGAVEVLCVQRKVLVREPFAKYLGFRTSVLDGLVTSARPRSKDDDEAVLTSSAATSRGNELRYQVKVTAQHS